MTGGHRFEDVLSYTLPQVTTFHAAMQFRKKNEDIHAISTIRLGTMMAQAESKDFVKLLKEIEDGD